MSLNNTLHNLRSKPEHVRNRIAFWSSLGITAMIFMFWLASGTLTNSKDSVLTQTLDKLESPQQALTASVGGFFGDIKDMIFRPKKIEYSEIEVSGGSR